MKKIIEMSIAQRHKSLADSRLELAKIKLQAKKSPHQVSELKRNIARILTVNSQMKKNKENSK